MRLRMTNAAGAMAPALLPSASAPALHIMPNKVKILATPKKPKKPPIFEAVRTFTAYVILSNASLAEVFLLP